MNVFINNIAGALYNIRSNKMYAAFYVVITTVIFIFITILLQMVNVILNSPPPFVNAARTIQIYEFKNPQGVFLDGFNAFEIRNFMEGMKGWEKYAIVANEDITLELNGKIVPAHVTFVDGGFWKVNEFDFISGRAFTDEEIKNHERSIVITKTVANRYFQGDAIGKEVDLQGKSFKVIGVVDDYSTLANPLMQGNVWVPYLFNKYIPSGDYTYAIDILFPKEMPVAEMKQNVHKAVMAHFQNRNETVDFKLSAIKTIRELTVEQLGGGKFVYGVGAILLLLLIIPAVNIITLSEASADSRMQEIAIRKAIGSSKARAFLQIISENLLLVMSGVILGIVLAFPVSHWINNLFQASGTPLATSNISILLILGIIILGILFTILSGALPAYLIVKKNISTALKGGAK